MATKKVLLALNPGLYGLIKEKAEKRFMGVQEFIYEILRKEVLKPKGKAGRPVKLDEPLIAAFARKR